MVPNVLKLESLPGVCRHMERKTKTIFTYIYVVHRFLRCLNDSTNQTKYQRNGYRFEKPNIKRKIL